jgi:hypothetical protein
MFVTLILVFSGQMSAAQQASAAAAKYKLSRITLPSGKKVVLRWNPCQKITYRVNLASMPASSRKQALSETKASLSRLGKSTGITFVYKGGTSIVPRTSNLSKLPAQIVVAFTRASKTDYPLGGATLGYGGYQYAWWSTAGGGYQAAITRGFVVLDTPDLVKLQPGLGKGQTQGNVIQHEMGHVVGLMHISDRSQLMYPTLFPSAPNGYASGDKAGLVRVGRKAGCIAVPTGL